MLELTEFLRKRIQWALEEDIQSGDVTTLATIPKNHQSKAILWAKSSGIFCGASIADLVLSYFHPSHHFQWKKVDGDHVIKGDRIGEFTGPTEDILQAERTLLNLIQRMSGIATETNRFVSAVKHSDCKILDTRKTIPLWRDLDKYSVVCGGGVNHRIGLFDMVLIKDNHITAAGGVEPAIKQTLAYFAKTGAVLDIEIEVKNLEELAVVLSLNGVSRILLDNMSLDMTRSAVQMTQRKIPLEASGNMTLERVPSVADTGVDFISVGSLTHSVTAMDISLLIE